MHPIVFGATGYIGSHICEQLRLAGHSVTAVVRNTAAPTFLQSIGVNICTIDFCSDDAIVAAIQGHDVVYNCIASVKLHQPIAAHRAVDVALTQRVAQAAVAAHAKRFVQLSTVQVYGFERPAKPIDEDHPCHASYAFNQVAQEREAAIRQTIAPSNTELVIVRPANTHGKRDRTLQDLVGIHQKGFMVVFGDATNAFSCIDTRDLGQAMVLLGEAPQLAHDTYLIKGYDTTWTAIKDALDSHTGRSSQLLCIPARFGKSIAGILEKITPYAFNLPITPFAVAVMSTQTLFDDSRIRALGFAPQHDVWETIASFLHE